ncbi:MAG: hypothetical protein ACI9UV_001407 [Algoriphagus sp.]|jgi:hypothetical protein|tara:strand:+ start:132 stop:287 length:156 start_codon:yes stop_codon:yes gene_type:complete
MRKITKRDVAFFFMGLVAFFIIDSMVNWNETVAAFKKGYEDGRKSGLSIPE